MEGDRTPRGSNEPGATSEVVLPRLFISRLNLCALVVFLIAFPAVALTKVEMSALSLSELAILVAITGLFIVGMWRPGRHLWTLRLGCWLVFLTVMGTESATFGQELGLLGEGAAPSGRAIVAAAGVVAVVLLVVAVRRLPDVARVSFNVGMLLWMVQVVWLIVDHDGFPKALGHGVLWLVAALPALAFALHGPRRVARVPAPTQDA